MKRPDRTALKAHSAALGTGTCLFVMFWLVLDNFALGLALGVALGAAFSKINDKPIGDAIDTQDLTKDKHE